MKATNYAIPQFLKNEDIKHVRKKLMMTQLEFAELVGVSKKTVESWEVTNKKIKGPIVFLIRLLNENPKLINAYIIPKKNSPLRLWYMYKNEVTTILDVDELHKEVDLYNYTANPLLRALGNNEHPSFAEYEAFLESRCFPKERDKMKLILRDLDIPFYDPLMIIEKTEGRMAEDDFWIKIER